MAGKSKTKNGKTEVPPAPNRSSQIMTDQDVTEYMDTLMSGKSKRELTGMEADVLTNLRTTTRKVNAATQRLKALDQERGDVAEFIKRSAGQMDALATLLINAEAERREAEWKQADKNKEDSDGQADAGDR